MIFIERCTTEYLMVGLVRLRSFYLFLIPERCARSCQREDCLNLRLETINCRDEGSNVARVSFVIAWKGIVSFHAWIVYISCTTSFSNHLASNLQWLGYIYFSYLFIFCFLSHISRPSLALMFPIAFKVFLIIRHICFVTLTAELQWKAWTFYWKLAGMAIVRKCIFINRIL